MYQYWPRSVSGWEFKGRFVNEKKKLAYFSWRCANISWKCCGMKLSIVFQHMFQVKEIVKKLLFSNLLFSLGRNANTFSSQTWEIVSKQKFEWGKNYKSLAITLTVSCWCLCTWATYWWSFSFKCTTIITLVFYILLGNIILQILVVDL